jgi:hypothetical protein
MPSNATRSIQSIIGRSGACRMREHRQFITVTECNMDVYPDVVAQDGV